MKNDSDERRFHIGILSIEDTQWEVARDKKLGVVFRARTDKEWLSVRYFRSLMAFAVVKQFLDHSETLVPIDMDRQTDRQWSVETLAPVPQGNQPS